MPRPCDRFLHRPVLPSDSRLNRSPECERASARRATPTSRAQEWRDSSATAAKARARAPGGPAQRSRSARRPRASRPTARVTRRSPRSARGRAGSRARPPGSHWCSRSAATAARAGSCGAARRARSARSSCQGWCSHRSTATARELGRSRSSVSAACSACRIAVLSKQHLSCRRQRTPRGSRSTSVGAQVVLEVAECSTPRAG